VERKKVKGLGFGFKGVGDTRTGWNLLVAHVVKSLLILQLWCGFWLQSLHNTHSCVGENTTLYQMLLAQSTLQIQVCIQSPQKSNLYLASINWRFFKQNLQHPPNHRIAIYPAGINCTFLKRNLQVLPIAQESNLISQIIAGSTKALKSNLSCRCQLPIWNKTCTLHCNDNQKPAC